MMIAPLFSFAECYRSRFNDNKKENSIVDAVSGALLPWKQRQYWRLANFFAR
jgi:hypothetical protein